MTIEKKRYDEAFEVDSLKILETGELTFSVTDSGYLDLDFGGETYRQVSLIRLIPFFETSRYISVSWQDSDKEWHEIGVIEDVEALPASQKKIVLDYLAYRYYIPELLKIHTITDNRMGYLFIDAETSAGRKTISVNDWWNNFRLRDNLILNVTDADGNRYVIPDVGKMDRTSMKKLQLFI